jgi:AraC family transcriptional regulator
VFPYRGLYVRHLGDDQAVAEANQVLFFNDAESCRLSYPVPGGDASLALTVSKSQLREPTPRALETVTSHPARREARPSARFPRR